MKRKQKTRFETLKEEQTDRIIDIHVQRMKPTKVHQQNMTQELTDALRKNAFIDEKKTNERQLVSYNSNSYIGCI